MKANNYANWKHSAYPPIVLPLRQLKRVALMENAHPQLSNLQQSQAPVSSLMLPGLGLAILFNAQINLAISI
jgi:hypothetical protein